MGLMLVGYGLSLFSNFDLDLGECSLLYFYK